MSQYKVSLQHEQVRRLTGERVGEERARLLQFQQVCNLAFQ